MIKGLSKINEAAEGLVYISETDAPFHSFYLEATVSLPKTILKITEQEDGNG